MIIEARINEYAMRDRNPHVPWTADEIADTAARCREAGASILHYHARAPDGSPRQTLDENALVISKVRAACDILILPTLGFTANDDDPGARIDCMMQLARDPATKPDIVPIDTGSLNLETFDRASGTFSHPERIYSNRTDVLLDYARQLRSAGIKPKLTCWSVGFVRRGVAMAEAGLLDAPLYFLLNMTDGPYITGHPGTSAGLDAFLAFLPRHIPHLWTANIVGGDLLALADTVAARGGNLAPGIGDYAYGHLGCPRNEEVVRRVAEIGRAHGRDIATPDDVRELLDLPGNRRVRAATKT